MKPLSMKIMSLGCDGIVIDWVPVINIIDSNARTIVPFCDGFNRMLDLSLIVYLSKFSFTQHIEGHFLEAVSYAPESDWNATLPAILEKQYAQVPVDALVDEPLGPSIIEEAKQEWSPVVEGNVGPKAVRSHTSQVSSIRDAK